jgi:hypothetical protein
MKKDGERKKRLSKLANLTGLSWDHVTTWSHGLDNMSELSYEYCMKTGDIMIHAEGLVI